MKHPHLSQGFTISFTWIYSRDPQKNYDNYCSHWDNQPKYSGWWLTYHSEKYEFVKWDDDIPNIWKVIKFHGSKPPTSIY